MFTLTRSARLGPVVGLALGALATTTLGASPVSALPTPTITNGDMLIANHSFENGLTSWKPTNGRGGPASKHCLGAATTGSVGATDGASAAQFTGEPPCKVAGLLSAPVAAKGGQSYTVFADASGGRLSLGLRFLDASGAQIDAQYSDRMTSAEHLEFTAAAPAGTASIAIELGSQGRVSVDDVRITAPLTKVGPQINRRGSFLAMAAGYDEKGRAVTFAVATGNANQPAGLVVTDILTGSVTRTIDLPGATGSWTIEQAPDGTVYVGTYQAPRVYAWTPGSATARVVGALPLAGAGIVYGMDAAPDGTIYGGSWGEATTGYAGAQLWKYRPDTGFSKFGPTLRTDAYYTFAVAHDDATNTVWAGTGTKPGLWGCSATTEKCTDFSSLLGDFILSKVWVYGITADSGYVQVWGGDAKSHGDDALVILKVGQTADGTVTAQRVTEIRGVIYNGGSEIVDGKVYYTKANTGTDIPLFSYDVRTGVETRIDGAPGGIYSRQWEAIDLKDPAWPGTSIVGWSAQGVLVAYNPATGNFKRVYVENIPMLSTGLNALTAGPDGRIWTSGYLTGGLGVVTPMRDDQQATYLVGFQAESMTSHAGRVYMGSYPYGQVQSFAPAEVAAGANVRTDCNLGSGQNRPYGILGQGDRVYYGSQAGYGQVKGAFGWEDLKTGTCTTVTDQIGNYSINTLTASAGKIFGGANIFFAWDALPTEKEAFVLVYDEATGAFQKVAMPFSGVRSVDALTTDASGLVWAYAGGWLFALDPHTLTWVHSEKILDWGLGERISGHEAALVAHPDGRIYGEAAGRGVFTFDPKATLASGSAKASLQVIVRGNTLGLTIDEYKNLWTIFGSTQLLRIDPRTTVAR